MTTAPPISSGEWTQPFSDLPLVRAGNPESEDFVHIHPHAQLDSFDFKEKYSPLDRTPRPLHHFHTYGGRSRSASTTNMENDDDLPNSKLGRMSSLHGWRTSVRRSMAHLSANYHHDKDPKGGRKFTRHGSSPGHSRTGGPLTAPSAFSLHQSHRPPPVTRSYSSGNNSLAGQPPVPTPGPPPLCNSPTSAMSTVSSDASDFADLFTIANTRASKSTNNLADTLQRVERAHSKAKREILGALQTTSFLLPTPQRFASPTSDQASPFSSTSSPFSSWDQVVLGDNSSGNLPKNPMPRKASVASSATSSTSWYEPSRRRGAPGARRTCRADDGREIRSVYPVGWERSVLDLEGRLHETMYEVAGGQHTFVDVDEDKAPATVLDLGTGTGLWAISQALAWPETRFVAADLVPCHTDLASLAEAEDQARTSSSGTAPGKGQWRSVADRINFQQYDFLDGLPYDTGSFDMVHMRFLGLGVPEHRWGDLLDEAVRVLKPGGVLEIVEMSHEAPPSANTRVRKAYAQLLLDDYVAPNPVLALQLHLPATSGIQANTVRPVFSTIWEIGTSPSADAPCSLVPGDGAPADALADAAMTWIRSALDYKDVQRSDEGDRAMRALMAANPLRWGATESDKADTPKTPTTPGMPITPIFEGRCSTKVSLAAYVCIKLAA